MSLLAWREHPSARQEYSDALAWYEDQEPGLGSRLADSLDAEVDFIRQWPNAAPPVPGRRRDVIARRKTVEAFPYEVIYLVRGREVIVVAYAHERRRPGYWQSRLADL